MSDTAETENTLNSGNEIAVGMETYPSRHPRAVLGTGNSSSRAQRWRGCTASGAFNCAGKNQASLITAGAKVILCHCCICKATQARASSCSLIPPLGQGRD